MTYNPDAPPDPYNPYDPRNDPYHPENPNPFGGGGPGGGPGGGAGGGGGIVILAILYLIMILSTAAVISATIAAPVLVTIGKLLDWDDPPPWSWAFSAAFLGFFAYFLVAVLLISGTGNKDLYDVPANLWTIPNLLQMIEIQSLPLLACGSVIWWRLKEHFRGFAGFPGWLRSLGAAALCLWISTAMIAATGRRVADANESSQSMIEGMMGLGLVSSIFSIGGALVAMIPLAIVVKASKSGAGAKIGFWKTYFAAFLVLLVWFNGSLLLEFLFNTLDPVYFFFKEEEVRAEVLKTQSKFGYLLPYYLGFLCTQLVVFGWAGHVVAARLRPVFEGRSGWMLASFLSFMSIVAAITPFAVLLTALYFSGAAPELFQSF